MCGSAGLVLVPCFSALTQQGVWAEKNFFFDGANRIALIFRYGRETNTTSMRAGKRRVKALGPKMDKGAGGVWFGFIEFILEVFLFFLVSA